MHPFLQKLEKEVLICDGAMGTQLYARGIPIQSCFDLQNLLRADLVAEIHRSYIRAGAEIIQTNTFGANRIRLAQFGAQDMVREINLKGVKIARESREIEGESVFTAGSMGPTGTFRPDLRGIKTLDIHDAFREQAEGLLEGGVDLFILETFSDTDELSEAVSAVREVSDLPIIAQLSFLEDARTLSGMTPREAASVLCGLPVNVIGCNCCVGPQIVLDVVSEMAPASTLPLSAQPNAGLPGYVGGRFIYFASPAYMAEYARRFMALGIRVLGGCCGTTPGHIRAIRHAIEHPARRDGEILQIPAQPPEEAPAPAEEVQEPADLLSSKLGKKFVISVEIDPPKGIRPRKMLEGAAALKEAGVDCINIADSPMARVRMSCIAMASLIQSQIGLPTIIHFTTRDRNLMGLQSDLIGAWALGIRNVLALTGDPPRLGDYPNATAVYDVDAIGLIKILKKFNEGLDWAGNSIGHRTSFCIAAAADMAFIVSDEKEYARFMRKLEAGADFIMTQPIYDVEILESFLDRTGPLPVPILLGVLPLQSYRHAEYLHNEVPGITIPEGIRKKMHEAQDRGIQEGLCQAAELLSRARPLVSGTYLMPSFGRYEVAAELVRMLCENTVRAGSGKGAG